MLKKLQDKLSKQEEQAKQYIVTGTIPGHMENPPRMNWHIEKDGVYIAKGNGILKYSSINNYYKYQSYIEDWTIVKKVDRGMRKISKAQPRHAGRTKVQPD